jgi:hypothetical protein
MKPTRALRVEKEGGGYEPPGKNGWWPALDGHKSRIRIRFHAYFFSVVGGLCVMLSTHNVASERHCFSSVSIIRDFFLFEASNINGVQNLVSDTGLV